MELVDLLVGLLARLEAKEEEFWVSRPPETESPREQTYRTSATPLPSAPPLWLSSILDETTTLGIKRCCQEEAEGRRSACGPPGGQWTKD